MQSKHTTTDGIKMRWEEQGDGPVVVLLHGLPTSPRLWRRVIPAIEGARTLAWEMVGYGGSIEDGRGRDLSVRQQADYLIAWMDALGLGDALLVGHDLGGGVAQISAVKHPERVRGLVLTNTVSYDSWPIPAVKAMRAGGALVEQLPDAMFELMYKTLIRQGHDNKGRAEASIAAHWPYYASATGRAAEDFVRQVRALNVQDTLSIANRLPNLDIPARLVWGAADRFQKIGYGYRLAYDLDAPLDRIEGGKHFTPEDHPDRIAAAINELLGEREDGRS